jgi:preprotein translocase subunit YajC
MDSAFKAWVGHPVVLQVAVGDIKVPLRGKLLKVGDKTVRIRIGDGWDVDIYKAMIMAVEEDSMVMLPA